MIKVKFLPSYKLVSLRDYFKQYWGRTQLLIQEDLKQVSSYQEYYLKDVDENNEHFRYMGGFNHYYHFYIVQTKSSIEAEDEFVLDIE